LVIDGFHLDLSSTGKMKQIHIKGIKDGGDAEVFFLRAPDRREEDIS
jgi:hypothetical protein